MQRGRSPGNDDGRASVAAATSAMEGGFHDRRRSRSGGSGSSGGSGRRHGPSASSASAQPGGSVSGNVGNSKNGVSPRGQRKDVLIYSYVMHQQMQQGRRHQLLPSRRKHLRSPFFASLRRRSSEANSNNDDNNTNAIGDESIGGGDSQQQGSIPRGNCNNNIDDGSSSNKKGSTHHRNNYNSNPWTLPPNIQLAPRMDIWRILAVSSCAAVASIGQTFASTNSSSSSDKYAFSSWDKLALSTCILTFVSSLLMAVGVRYTPFRRNVSQPFFNSNSEVSREQGRLLSRLQLMTVEILILTVLSILWIFSMPVIVNGNAYYNSSMDGSSSWGVPLAVAGYDIWNANLFYSSWISSLLCGYLWIEVFTLNDRGGTTSTRIVQHQHDTSSNEDRRQVATTPFSNVFTKRWSFLLCTATILLSSSISTYTSPVCQGKILKSTSYCQLALTGIIVGGVFQLLITLCVGLLYQLSHMSRNGSNNDNVDSATTILSIRKRNLFTSVAAVMSLILQIINTALLTSPTGGGPGSISGTLYFACWMGFVLSFELCLRYLDVYSATVPSDESVINARTMSEDDVTVYEDNDDAEDSGRNIGMMNTSDEENANPRMMGTNAPKQEDKDVDNSQFFFSQPKPVERKTPSPVTNNIKEVDPGRHEPSVASSTERSDPEGFTNLSQKPPSFNDSSPSIDPEGVFGVSYFTNLSMNSRKKDDYQNRVQATRMKEPDATNSVVQTKEYPVKKEKNRDDVHAGAPKLRRKPSSSSLSASNLSPLVEGNAEDASPDNISPETIIGNVHAATRRSGSNGRMTPTLQRDTRQHQQQQKQVDQTRSAKSGTSSRSSRSRSRENAVRSSYPVSSGGGSRSRHSTTPPQQKAVPLVSALLGNQRYSRSGSGGQSKSPKTASSRAVESSNSTPDDSGSNPPLTISDEMSSEGDLMHDSNKNVIGSNDYVGPHPPPPPLPFQTPRISSPPMQSIRTSIEGQGETDTVVSDPTLDAGLEDSIGTPSPRPSRPKPVLKNSNNNNDSRPQLHHTSSSSTNSYEKKLSDDTNLLTRVRSISSDENLSSNEGQTGIKVVDDIVAAALAYAEMTHGVAAGSRAGTAVRRGSGTTTLASSQRPIPSTPQSSVQKKKPSKGTSKKHKEARSIATSGESSSSVHSYYSKKRGGQHNTTSPGHPCSTPVDELLVKAFSQAHHGHGHVGEQHQQQYRQKQQWSTRGSAAQSMKSGISVESVYSQEETEFSTRADYDC